MTLQPKNEFKMQETGAINVGQSTAETKPWARWWWHGSAVNKEELTASLEAFKEAGLEGGDNLIYGTKGEEERFIEYLSPEWMRCLHTLEEARRLVWCRHGQCCRMAIGGPWVTRYSSRYFAAKTYQISEEKRFLTLYSTVRTCVRTKQQRD